MAHEAAAEIALFAHAPPVGQYTHNPNQDIEHVLPFVLAFDTDLKESGKTEPTRYAERYGTEKPALRAISVVGRGFWSWANDQWHDNVCKCREGEVVGLVAALVNACQRVAKTRLQPDMRDYLDKQMPPPQR